MSQAQTGRGGEQQAALKLTAVRSSQLASHCQVSREGQVVGEVWAEDVLVVVSKLTEPRRMEKKRRWFGKVVGHAGTIGRGTRLAMLMGPGLKTRGDVLRAVESALFASSEAEQTSQ